MVLAIFLLILFYVAVQDRSILGMVLFGGILVVHLKNKLGKIADKNAPVPKTPKPAKPRHSLSQSRDYNQLLSAIISFIDSNGRDFDYLYLGRYSSGADYWLPNNASVCLPYGYVPNQCIAVIYPNGRSVCYNFFQNGKYILSDEAEEYLAYQLALHYGGQHFLDYDDGDLRSCIIHSRSLLEKYKAYRKREKAYLNSLKHL